ncbi:MAG: hypothetical protein B6A08_13255 [Sorangiineae bacterium NIC37A_2]|nr:MAG: hypothetical protein B6A08_13255 [Sorangiineae bacterium NIC37A_2]
MTAIDVSALGPGAQRVLSAEAPPPMKMLAARGIVPGAAPPDLLAILVVLSEGDSDVARTAQGTLRALPKPLLEGALSGELQAGVLFELAAIFATDTEVLPRLLRMKALDSPTLLRLCQSASEASGEIIATNEALILRYPEAIEVLYMNPRVRMSTSDRLIDLAVRNGIELEFPAFKLAAQAIKNQLIPEPTEEPTFDDELYKTASQLSHELSLAEEEDVCDEDEEGKLELKKKFVPLFAQIQDMTVTQKIRSAMLGNSTMRMILVRDTNRLVAEAVARSPRLTENEVVRITASRSVSDDVLRIIANSREHTRSYQVKLNLVCNPRTPFSFASRLVPHIRSNDLRAIGRSKNVPGAVSRLAVQQLSRQK